MSSIKATEIDGDVAIGRHTTIGGNAIVRGAAAFKKNLKVEGWLDAPNIKGVNKGIFQTEAKLCAAYPQPLDGWFAGVMSTAYEVETVPPLGTIEPMPQADEDESLSSSSTVQMKSALIRLYTVENGKWVKDSDRLYEIKVNLDDMERIINSGIIDNAEALNELIGLYINQNLATDEDLLEINNLITVHKEQLQPLIDNNIPGNAETLDSIICDYASGDLMKADDYNERINNIELAVERTLPVEIGNNADAIEALKSHPKGVVHFLSKYAPKTGGATTVIYDTDTEFDEADVIFDTEKAQFYGYVLRTGTHGKTVTLYSNWAGRDAFYDSNGSIRKDSLFADADDTLYMINADATALQPVGGHELIEQTEAAKRAVFNDMWNALCGQYGKYDPDNAPDAEYPYFLNEIWLTYEEAIETVSFHNPTNRDMTGAAMDNTTLRTVIPRSYRIDADFSRAFQSAIALESFASLHNSCFPINMSMAFWNCSKLKKISEAIVVNNCISFNRAFEGCISLEYVQFNGLKVNISFADSPLLSLASLQYLVAKSANGTTTITVTVHPDVYAKLTDTANTEWHKVLTDAAYRYISFATV